MGVWISIFKNSAGAAPVAQRFSTACSPRCDPGGQGSSPTSGSVRGACFCLCLCLCPCLCPNLSLSLWINFLKNLKNELKKELSWFLWPLKFRRCYYVGLNKNKRIEVYVASNNSFWKITSHKLKQRSGVFEYFSSMLYSGPTTEI